MAEIIELDEHRAHNELPIQCARCGHEWVAVYPADMEWVECPECEFNNSSDLDLTPDQREFVTGVALAIEKSR